MAEAIAERVDRYVLDGSDEDLRRLLSIAQCLGGYARRAVDRIGIQDGWRAIECGCGPVGALTVLADAVGPNGRVVGVDFGEPAAQRAQSIIAALALDNVRVVSADVHDVGVSDLHGPFDLAYTRCFLMHQTDPVHTLSRIGALVRPGGWIIAQEPLRRPPPRSHPHLCALEEYWELMHELAERSGVPHLSVDDLPRAARAAGLEVVSTEGFFDVMPSDVGFGIHASSVTALRERALKAGVAAEQLDELSRVLTGAKEEGYDWVTTPFLLDLALRKPPVASNSTR